MYNTWEKWNVDFIFLFDFLYFYICELDEAWGILVDDVKVLEFFIFVVLKYFVL